MSQSRKEGEKNDPMVLKLQNVKGVGCWGLFFSPFPFQIQSKLGEGEQVLAIRAGLMPFTGEALTFPVHPGRTRTH